MIFRTAAGQQDIAQALELYWVNEPAAAAAEDHDAVLEHWLRMFAGSPDGFWIAEDEGAGRIVGVATALRRSPLWILANFYVHPAYQGQGIGKRLLSRAISTWEDCTRFLVHASTNPAAQGLYLHFGMRPLPYSILFKGIPAAKAQPPELTVQPYPVGDVLPALDDLDRQALGFTRPADHLRWGSLGTYYLVTEHDKTAGYFRVSPDGILGPLVVSGEAWIAPALDWAIVKQQAESAGEHEVFVPGANRAAITHLLARGYRFHEIDLLMSSHPMPGLARVVFHDMDFL